MTERPAAHSSPVPRPRPPRPRWARCPRSPPRRRGQAGAAVYRFKLGAYELTALYDGIWFRPIDEKFVRNASRADVQKALADNFLRPACCRSRSRRCWSIPARSSC